MGQNVSNTILKFNPCVIKTQGQHLRLFTPSNTYNSQCKSNINSSQSKNGIMIISSVAKNKC